MKITAEEFDKKFENEDMSEYLDFSKAKRMKDFKKNVTKKINIDLPEHIIEMIDKEASNIGVARQSLLKVWIVERLKEELAKPL